MGNLIGDDSVDPSVYREFVEYRISVLDKEIKERQIKKEAFEAELLKLTGQVNVFTESKTIGDKKPELPITLIDDRDREDAIDDVKDEKKYAPLPKLNWKHEVLGSLSSYERLCTSEEIYDDLLEDHPKISDCKKSEVIAKISNALTSLSKAGQVKKEKNRLGKGNFWGYSSWFDGDEVKQVHKEKLAEEYGLDIAAIFAMM
ncbi:hypothetical protein [uncultured Imperialibacter sp.]|uniref:hypothetical protein n=1 Tax=uncultured Imperialibacter sp. TaxID=1672639 RepID=UPI0030DA7967